MLVGIPALRRRSALVIVVGERGKVLNYSEMAQLNVCLKGTVPMVDE